ncbi:hypothetical protein NC796_03845 [Aliifodinibius sp. S!AR15-10]|uniref:hypothetical protein n=1 Tax=Aliifodinibius sp. S!AR15-10 TaxID=2950437 RepID=UPI00285A72F1|nr:hypothetical protein [Aliifodinibius sp. S!AR15-10]MDR8390259.1 hypothetical protein [Aliifodinibius sp. S!AR15-10]
MYERALKLFKGGAKPYVIANGANEMIPTAVGRQSPFVWGSLRPEIRQLADAMTIPNGVVLQRPLKGYDRCNDFIEFI